MTVKIIKGDITSFKADATVLFLFVGSSKIVGLDTPLRGLIDEERRTHNFMGLEREFLNIPTGSKLGSKRIIILGLGDPRIFSAETLRRSGAILVKALRGKNIKTVAISPIAVSKYTLRESAQAFTEGILLTRYEFNKYKVEKSKKKEKNRQELVIIEKNYAKLKQIRQGIGAAETWAAATCYARDLVNEPASVCVPSHLAEHARQIAKASKGKIKVKIFNREECKKRGMGAFLAVAAGAGEEPYFIHLIYKEQNAKRKIALVGKGITFDSGGLQIKPGESMATMKLDMAGAAAVLGVFSRIAEIAPNVEVHGIIAATENMPGSRAYKPGDIVRAMNGKTIEIGHTDAEGRVTLADSLAYAAKLKPDAIIDLATLTGACMVALGEEVAGTMSNNKKLADKIKSSAKVVGEKMWELPLVPEYKQLIKGTHGDIKNSGGTRYGGAITAGLFLEEFVGGVPWVHLDIAGPAYAERETVPYIPLGGTGFGVRTLIDFLKNL